MTRRRVPTWLRDNLPTRTPEKLATCRRCDLEVLQIMWEGNTVNLTRHALFPTEPIPERSFVKYPPGEWNPVYGASYYSHRERVIHGVHRCTEENPQ